MKKIIKLDQAHSSVPRKLSEQFKEAMNSIPENELGKAILATFLYNKHSNVSTLFPF